MNKLTPSLIGIAGVHYVASELSRRGLIALPTTRNVAAFDIVVSTPDGRKHANIQVKASLKRVSFFPMPSSKRVSTAPRTWYVLLRWIASEGRFEGFMISGRMARNEVHRVEQRQQRRINRGQRTKQFPAIHVGVKVEDRAKRWRKKWLQWTL